MKLALWNFYVDNKSIIFCTLAAIALLLIATLIIAPWQAELRALVIDEKTHRPDLASLGKLFAGLVTIVGGGFALWRWTIDQRWRRVQYAEQLLEKFFAKNNTKLALRMLDVQGETNLSCGEDEEPEIIDLTEEIFIDSLRTLEEQQRYEKPYFKVRMIFDEFFTDLSMFQHHIEAGLIKPKDIRPYLQYWIKSINGYGKIYTIELARQANKFLAYFEYDAVLRLSVLLGYPLKKI